MGKTRETQTQQSSQTVTPQPTAEERELNRLYLEREKFLDPQIRQTQSQGLSLVEQLLRGRSDLPGFLGTLPGGISPEVTQDIVSQSLRDLNTQLAFSGGGTFLESGASQAIGGRVAGDVRRAAEEFNLGNRLNLLNLALSGQAQVQQPILGYSSLLSQRLSGLRPVTTDFRGNSSGMTRYSLFTSPTTTAFAQGLGGATGKALFGG